MAAIDKLDKRLAAAEDRQKQVVKNVDSLTDMVRSILPTKIDLHFAVRNCIMHDKNACNTTYMKHDSWYCPENDRDSPPRHVCVWEVSHAQPGGPRRT